MKKRLLTIICFVLAACLFLFGCTAKGNKTNETNANHDTLYQTALLQSLMLGDYYGSVPVGELKKYGDIGIGTFDKLNGELIMLDGKVYSGLSDGTLKEMDDSVTVPFSDVTFFDENIAIDLNSVTSMDDLKAKMDEAIEESGINYFYMIRIDGEFKHVEYRSELSQEEPYKPLANVMVTDQVLFDADNTSGTIVGLYCPAYMDGLNTAGWHFHFVSGDLSTGGHLLNIEFDTAIAKVDKTTSFSMSLPDENYFNEIDLTSDLEKAIGKVEQNK